MVVATVIGVMAAEELVIGDHKKTDFASMDKLFGALVQYPDTTGRFDDYSSIAQALHKNGAYLTVAADPLSLVLAKPPRRLDVSSVPTWLWAPCSVLACPCGSVDLLPRTWPRRRSRCDECRVESSERVLAQCWIQLSIAIMPYHVTQSVDRLGNPAYRLTLQTREQHIRLDKATSNVCTAQVLLANIAGMYSVYHRKDGLQKIAKKVHGLAQLFASEAGKAGMAVAAGSFFDTVTIDAGKNAKAVVEKLQAKQLNMRAINDSLISAAFDETHLQEDVHALIAALKEAGVGGSSPTAAASMAVNGESLGLLLIDGGFARSGPFLEQKIFNSISSETELMRYMFTLQKKDLALDTSMISLGKLNSVSSLAPCSWPEVGNMHPFAPHSQTAGYREMLESLEKYLISCTGFDACSLQPTSGASGEYAGLLVIRKYLEAKGEGHRDVCIIPRSAHGTNPASAAMCGMEIKWIEDSRGMDLEEFKALCAEYKDCDGWMRLLLEDDRLACLMVTYPSTRAFFEDNIQDSRVKILKLARRSSCFCISLDGCGMQSCLQEICSTVHENGGQVYMDGANMNAQLGLTSPGMIGADVCHLNLHKTFSIPHGGGGPGLGPICAKKHLAPHLPGHCVVNPSTAGSDPAGAVSAAPWGQAGIACIPWMFCTMLGKQGVLDSGRYSILNANYMKSRLEPHFDIAPTNKNNRCAHEFIMDFSDIRKKSGIVEEDIAKRLQDPCGQSGCEGDPNAAGVAQSSDKMLSVQKNNENRSLKTNRLFPTPNKPDPMPQNLAFLFTKITPDWDNKDF
eukprot:s731_g5.t1